MNRSGRGIAAVFVFLLLLSPLANAQHLHFPPVPDSPYPYTIAKVRKVWVFAIEHDYRLAQRINRGEFDEEAECEMLLHNIRLADRLGKTGEAKKLRKRHRELEIHRSGVTELETMRSLVLQQSAMIEQMRIEIDMLKNCKKTQQIP